MQNQKQSVLVSVNTRRLGRENNPKLCLGAAREFLSQPKFAYSKTTETPEQNMKSVQS